MTQPIPAPKVVDPVNQALSKLLKPGAKTTEFITLIAVYAGVLATLLGAFNTSSPRFNAILKSGALLAAALSHFGYALSRGDAKEALGGLTTLAKYGVPLALNPVVGEVGTVQPSTHYNFGPSAGSEKLPSDSGATDLVGLVAGVLVIAGLIWLVIGFTQHRLDVFGLVLLLVGAGVFLVFGGIASTWRARRRY